ncbi:group 1 truncated hemoglobin [Svornostia abyssi]|uniref:Group 1 truncated hemoglobin n=1 Tax=Svornostia abyssi TaxID=2898438 RepID=A0ABY5PGZ5_9ACTN|nr:group 1 truncated hemoglobin [Parviterribacteraceae bacterium J379]
MAIYDDIGGRDAVAAAVGIFYDKVVADDLLGPYFTGRDMARQQSHMRAFLAVALGGPDVYAGRDMRAAHAGLQITDVAFDRVVELLVATLQQLEVPGDIITAIGAKLAPLRDDVVTVRAAAA